MLFFCTEERSLQILTTAKLNISYTDFCTARDNPFLPLVLELLGLCGTSSTWKCVAACAGAVQFALLQKGKKKIRFMLNDNRVSGHDKSHWRLGDPILLASPFAVLSALLRSAAVLRMIFWMSRNLSMKAHNLGTIPKSSKLWDLMVFHGLFLEHLCCKMSDTEVVADISSIKGYCNQPTKDEVTFMRVLLCPQQLRSVWGRFVPLFL